MIKALGAAAVVAIALLGTSAAHAQEWRPVARQCAEQIDRQAHCASCSGEWPAWAQCTLTHIYGDVSPSLVQDCIDQVAAKREVEKACGACGDPVADVISCVGQQ